MSRYLYATPTAESIRRLNNIFMSAPLYVDTNFKCCVDIVDDRYDLDKLPQVLKVKFAHIDVVTTVSKGVELPETIAKVDFLNYQSSLNPGDRHIAMCQSYLLSKSTRHFFASIKDILIFFKL